MQDIFQISNINLKLQFLFDFGIFEKMNDLLYGSRDVYIIGFYNTHQLQTF